MGAEIFCFRFTERDKNYVSRMGTINMISIKEKMKSSKTAVALYEAVFGRVHSACRAFHKELDIAKTRLRTKTRYCYGNSNRDKTFFVISCNTTAMGLYSMIFYVLPFIAYAVRKNYIPVIDLKTYLPLIQDEEKAGIENAWEYYYEQPVKQYALEEVYRSKHVIVMVDGAFRIQMPKWNEMFPTDEKTLKYWHNVVASYIRLTDDLKKRIATEKQKIFKPGQKVLGVGVRAGLRAGAMKNEELFNAHPKVPTCEEMMDLVENKMAEWQCDRIFLAIDDREYFNKFITRFGNKCCYLKRRLIHYFENDKTIKEEDMWVEYEGCSVRERTEEYVVETYLLAQCDSLYSCRGGGAAFAYYLNGGKYEHVEVYDAGLYEGLGK